MRTKIVYALVSSESDSYLEQTLLSVYSLRLYNKTAKVYLIIDQNTASGLVGNRNEIRKFIDDVVVVDTSEELNNMQRSRYLKTNIRQFIEGEFLFIDSDTVICGPLDEIDRCEAEIAMVADLNGELCAPEKTSIEKCWNAGFGDVTGHPYFNSGIIFAKDTPKVHSFYKDWYNNYLLSAKNNVPFDQPALCKTNIDHGHFIKELSGIWNCQFRFGQGHLYLSNAVILHYFTTMRKDQFWNYTEKLLYARIKEQGYVDDAIHNLLRNPRTLFYNTLSMNKEMEFLLISSPLSYIYCQYPSVYSIIDKLGKLIVRCLYRKSL